MSFLHFLVILGTFSIFFSYDSLEVLPEPLLPSILVKDAGDAKKVSSTLRSLPGGPGAKPPETGPTGTHRGQSCHEWSCWQSGTQCVAAVFVPPFFEKWTGLQKAVVVQSVQQSLRSWPSSRSWLCDMEVAVFFRDGGNQKPWFLPCSGRMDFTARFVSSVMQANSSENGGQNVLSSGSMGTGSCESYLGPSVGSPLKHLVSAEFCTWYPVNNLATKIQQPQVSCVDRSFTSNLNCHLPIRWFFSLEVETIICNSSS